MSNVAWWARRPLAWWLITGYSVLSLVFFLYFILWHQLEVTAWASTLNNTVSLFLLIILQGIKLLSFALLFNRRLGVYYLQILSMLANILTWLIVIPPIPISQQHFLIINMVIFSFCFFYWLRPEIRRLYIFRGGYYG